MKPPRFDQAPWRGGTRTALVYRDEQWDYDGLAARAAALARQLHEQRLLPGQVVAAVDHPGPDFIVLQHAIARLRAALLPLSPTMPPARREALITAGGVEWQWHGQPGLSGRLATTGLHPKPPPLTSPLALIVATSGSSGEPRGALLTQDNVLNSCRLVNARLDLRPGDRWLCCLPRDHVGGLSIGYRCAMAGAALVVMDGFDARAVRSALDARQVTHLSVVPPMLAQLLEVDPAPPASLRVLLVGGQALHGTLAAQAIANGWPLRITYGMTETFSQIATSQPLQAPPPIGVIGPPLPGVEIVCARDDERPVPLSVKGPVVMAGYANPERVPGLGLNEGWFQTSDLASRAPDGALRILGRADDLLVVGGHQVSLLSVEARLLAAPGIGAAVVVAIEEPVWGYSLAAAFTGSTTVGALQRWCREHLPSVERPRRFRRLDALPLLASGKYDRRLIRSWLRREPNGSGRH